MQRRPTFDAASNADQNPMNGPKEKGNIAVSPAFAPHALQMEAQLSMIQAQLSGVSSQAMGRPVVPLVWCSLV
jgi:hypothetical protein